jgi:hypothetical protein
MYANEKNRSATAKAQERVWADCLASTVPSAEYVAPTRHAPKADNRWLAPSPRTVAATGKFGGVAKL